MISRITRVIARPTIGSARGRPSPTAAALATTASETKPSTRAWLPSAISEGLARRRPARNRICAGTSLPAKPITPGCGEYPQVGEVLRVDQPVDRLVERDERADEDRRHDREAGQLLTAVRAQEECDPERHRGQGISDVVDQVGEKRDAPRGDEDRRLHECRHEQHGKRERDRRGVGRSEDTARSAPARAQRVLTKRCTASRSSLAFSLAAA